MRQAYIAASWSFGCLAIALLTIGSLAVPTQSAFADTSCAQECGTICSGYTPGTPEYNNCMGLCMYHCENPAAQSCPDPTFNPCPDRITAAQCLAVNCSNATTSCTCNPFPALPCKCPS